MAKRRRKPEQMGCAQYLAVAGLLVVVLLGISVVKAIASLGVVAIVIALPVMALYLFMRSRRSAASARMLRANRRHEPAVRLLTALAYTDDKLSRGEKEVLTSYLRSYVDADPEAVFVKPASIPGIGEIDRLINRCNITLDPTETDLLVEHVRRLRGTRRTHAPAARDRFDEAERRLSRVTVTGPVINDITEA